MRIIDAIVMSGLLPWCIAVLIGVVVGVVVLTNLLTNR